MADKSKIRMNLSAIKKVDPYAKDIVDSSSHVAFYTFNSDQNEWEKTDVEGAFFIYSRNAQPFHSIFINNRINTTSFVEPITGHLELQSQPPFLLYRNERSRIRGFWFYNSQECERIGNLVNGLKKSGGVNNVLLPQAEVIETPPLLKQSDVNIFSMLSKAQQEFKNSQTTAVGNQQNIAPGNVMKFFASAKTTATAEVPFFQRLLPNTLSVEQIEKQQRVTTPQDEIPHLVNSKQQQNTPLHCINSTIPDRSILDSFTSNFCPSVKPSPSSTELNTTQLTKLFDSASLSQNKPLAVTTAEQPLRQLHVIEPNMLHMDNASIPCEPSTTKPALMPPTMFEHPTDNSLVFQSRPEPLSQAQLVQAFTYLIQNDEDFVHKLYEAYLKSFTLVGTYK